MQRESTDPSVYTQVELDIAWKRHAKGRGLRWQIMRDLVAILSRKASTTILLQDVMSLKRGLSHQKVVEMLDELERSGAVKQFIDPAIGAHFTATELGVIVYLNAKRKNIPAKVVKELFFLVDARQLEESNDET